jgi:hypothetical protein
MGLKGWRKITARLAQMDKEELRDRVRQEFHKRQDGFLGRLGFDFAQGLRNSSPGQGGNFFFRGDSVGSLLTLVRERCPGQAERTVAQAEKICRHRFDLLGYEDLDFGTPIDWHLDAVHGKRAPRSLFYTVRYLDFVEVGDSKIIWELNRHQHFVTLAKAYRLTENDRYADELLRQWRQWQADNPYPLGINWASSLEVAIRSLSWIWSYHLMDGSPRLPSFRNEWLRGLSIHGRHIERYLSTYFSPNTHLLGEGVGLFFLGMLCPELVAAECWKSLGWEIVLRESSRQVQSDGFHFEQSTYYHVYALDMLLHFAVLASVNGMSIPAPFEVALEKMLTALCLLGRGGSPPRFGDDDGGRLFDPRRNRSEHLLDPLATGAVLFHRGDYKGAAASGGLREETIWLLGSEGVKQWDELESSPADMESTALKDSGLYLLATKPAAQLVVDVGPQGTQSGGHGHADALSVCLQNRDCSLLIDPGTYEYVGAGPDRDLFRGTAMHNTLQVDGANQSEIAGPFSWRRLTHTKVEQWIQGHEFDLLVASHDGYQNLPEPVMHQRWVLSLKNGLYFIRDVVTGEGKHQCEISWHLGPEMQLEGKNMFRVKGMLQGLALLPAEGQGWREEVRKEAWSPVYGQKVPTTTLKFRSLTQVPTEFAVLIVTSEEVHRRPGSFARLDHQGSGAPVSAYRFLGEAGEYEFYFGESAKPWTQAPVSSDAAFVCWMRSASGDQRLIQCNGSYTKINGEPELRCGRTVSWCEVVCEGSQRRIRSSNAEAIEQPAMSG